MTRFCAAFAVIAALCLLTMPSCAQSPGAEQVVAEAVTPAPAPIPKPRPKTIEQLIVPVPRADPAPVQAAPPAALPTTTYLAPGTFIAPGSAIAASPAAAPSTEPPGSGGIGAAAKAAAENIAMQILTWLGVLLGTILTASTIPIATFLVKWLMKKAQAAGIDVDEADRKRIQELTVNALHAGAAALPKDADGKVTSGMKGQLLDFVAAYVQSHGAVELKRLGVPVDSVEADDAIKARAEVALADPKVPVAVGEPAGPEKGPVIPVAPAVAAVPAQ